MIENYVLFSSGQIKRFSFEQELMTAAVKARFLLSCAERNFGLLLFIIRDKEEFYFYDASKATAGHWIKVLNKGEPTVIIQGSGVFKTLNNYH